MGHWVWKEMSVFGIASTPPPPLSAYTAILATSIYSFFVFLLTVRQVEALLRISRLGGVWGW
jgi:hypothetical protein